MNVYNSLKLSYPILILFLSGCGPSQQQLAQQSQINAKSYAYKACSTKYPFLNESNVKNAVPYAKCLIQVFNNYGGSDAERVLLYKRLELSEEVASGKISFASAQAQFATIYYQISSQQRMIANSNAIAKNTNCMSERQRVSGHDYSGIGSTNGTVAIVSLLGAMADGAAVSQACD